MTRYNAWITVLVMAGLGSGCATYESELRFDPQPASVTVTAEPASEADPVHVLASVVGVRTKHADEHPASVELRVLIDNNTRSPVRVTPADVELRSADLQLFPSARSEPDGALTIDPGRRGTLTLYYPFEAGKVPGTHDLDGLNLRLPITVGEQRLTRSVTFDRQPTTRVYRNYYDPWGPWYYRSGLRMGVGYGGVW